MNRKVQALTLGLLTSFLLSGPAHATMEPIAPGGDFITGPSPAIMPIELTIPPRVIVRGPRTAREVALVRVEKLRAQREAAARKERLRRERIAEKKREERQARREARIAARTATTSGILGDLSFLKSKPVQGNLTSAVANIPNRTSHEGWIKSMNALTGPNPDFISLNEVSGRSTESIQSLAPGYGIVRGERDLSRGAQGQSLNNVVLYRTDTWTKLAGGMVRVVNDDQGFLRKKPFVWDRFATWALLKRADGAVVSVISTHMPTNPGKYPQQHGNPPLSRIALYAKGMDTIKAMEAQLAAYGPVLVTGDMNSHAGQGDWTAVAKMATIGYNYTKDRGVMHIFFKNLATVVESRQFAVASDHPALITTLAMNGMSPA